MERTAAIVARTARARAEGRGGGVGDGEGDRPAACGGSGGGARRSRGSAGDQRAAADTGISIRRRSCWSGERFVRIKAAIDAEFDALDDLLRGIAAVGELTPRTSDLVVSFGERLSSRMVAEAFEQRGLNGVHVDARTCIITDEPLWQGGAAGGRDRGEADGAGAAAGRGGADAGDGRVYRRRTRMGLRRRWDAAAATIRRRWWAAGCMRARSRSGRT